MRLCTPCRRPGHNRRVCPELVTVRQLLLPDPRRHAETIAIREDMLRLLDSQRPTPPSALFGQLRDDWGTIGERRLWRSLYRLEMLAKVARVGPKCMPGVGYIRLCSAPAADEEAA